jgi:hypothetical protein
MPWWVLVHIIPTARHISTQQHFRKPMKTSSFLGLLVYSDTTLGDENFHPFPAWVLGFSWNSLNSSWAL